VSILAAEDGLLAKIRAKLMPQGAAKVRSVEALDGAWDENTLKAVLLLVPAVFIFWSGGRPVPNARTATMDAEWIVYAVTSNASGAAARRRGDGKAVGAYELVDTLVPLLHNCTIDGVGTLKFAGAECLFNGKIDKQGVCCYAISFTMTDSFPAEVDESALEPFETFAAFYDTPPHDNEAQHRKWIDGDESESKPDAKDTVQPEQS
jgi:phage gp37-like protein